MRDDTGLRLGKLLFEVRLPDLLRPKVTEEHARPNGRRLLHSRACLRSVSFLILSGSTMIPPLLKRRHVGLPLDIVFELSRPRVKVLPLLEAAAVRTQAPVFASPWHPRPFLPSA